MHIYKVQSSLAPYAATEVLLCPAGHKFDCIISQPWLDWTADEDGDSH